MDEATAILVRSPLVRLAGWGVTVAWPILGGAIIGMSIALFVSEPLWNDPSWYLYAASRLFDGAHIYQTEIVDVNPPLIIWISAIAIALGHTSGLAPVLALKLILAVVIAASIAWCLSLVRRSKSSNSGYFNWSLAIALLYVLVVVPRPIYVFAQREHFLATLILPYLVLAASRLGGKGLPRWAATIIGFAAATAVCLKPYQLLIVVGIEAFIVWRLRTPRILFRPELVAIVLGGLAYCALVLAFTPDFIFKIAPLARDGYLGWANVSLAHMIKPIVWLLMVVAIVVLYEVLRRRLHHAPLITIIIVSGCSAAGAYFLPDKGVEYRVLPVMIFWLPKVLSAFAIYGFFHLRVQHKALVSTMIVATCGAFGAYLLQHKDFDYLLLPAAIFFSIAVAISVIDLVPKILGRWWGSLPSVRVWSFGLGLFSCVIFSIETYSVRIAGYHFNEEKIYKTATANLPQRSALYVISPVGADDYVTDMLIRHEILWASRFKQFWMMETIFQNEVGHEGGHDKTESATRLAKYTRTAVVDDFYHWHPFAVLIERCADTSLDPCFSLEAFRVDLLQWFEKEPTFRAIWSKYAWSKRIGRFDLYLLKDR